MSTDNPCAVWSTAGPIRATAERTRDLIAVVARVAAVLNSLTPPEADGLWAVVEDLSVQLELGVPRRVSQWQHAARAADRRQSA